MMNVPQKQRSKRKWSSMMFWIVLSVVIVITSMLIGVIIWLVKTQELDKLYTKLGIIASILTILISPLIFLFTILKKPDSKPSKDLDPNIYIHPIQPASPQLSIELAQRSKVWNVPYRRNLFFTGRESLLKQLHDRLTATKTDAFIQSQAISGLGGIGKTQIAVEYAYRYRDEYQSILWVRAATRETLDTDFVTLAALLHLPERDVIDQRIILAAVKEWLCDNSDWLLILDNADNMELVSDFLPTRGSGHILLTTRSQATSSIADAIEVERMNKEEGIALLLGRAKVLSSNISLDETPEIDRINAEIIVNAVDGLPLALDQAGAYIEETGCSVSIYLERYQRYQTALLKRRGESSFGHPESVATTWSLSFAQIENTNPAAADLLRLCSFLAPDAIPEEIITDGVAELGSLLQPLATNLPLLDEAIAALRKFSLVRRDPQAKLLNMHRLVQAVIKDEMDENIQHQWAERTVRVVNHVFPWQSTKRGIAANGIYPKYRSVHR